MKATFPGILADAWRLFRNDWNILTAVAGLFVFLPSLAANLLVPQMPDVPENATVGSAAFDAYQQGFAEWAGHYGGWMLLANLLALFGQFAVVAVYLGGDRLAVSAALGKAGRRFPLLLLAGLVIGVPAGAIASIAMVFPPLIVALFVLMFWLLARTVVLAPVLLAEAPIGALSAIRRSFDLTRGNTFALAATVMTVVLAMSLLSRPFDWLDAWMLAKAPNPVARTLVDAASAAIVSLGSVAMGLAQVAAYRRLRTR